MFKIWLEEKIIRWTSIDESWVQKNDYSAHYNESNLIYITLNTIDYEIYVPENAQSGYAVSVTEKSSQKEYMLNPFEPIGIFFETQEVADRLGATKGETYIFPAFYFIWLKNDSDKEKIKQGIKDAMVIASFFVGGRELLLAKTSYKLFVSLLELSFSGIDLLLDEDTRNIIKDSEYSILLNLWDSIQILSGVTAIKQSTQIVCNEFLDEWYRSKNFLETRIKSSDYNKLEELVKVIEEGN